MKLIKVMGVALLSASLVACGTTDSKEGESVKTENKEKKVSYKIVDDKKAVRTKQRAIRVTTDSTKEKDFEQITKEVMKEYKGQGLDSVHLYIHEPDGDTFGDVKAHSFIAYTEKGSAQVGVTKENSYKIEVNKDYEPKKETSTDVKTSKEWQDSFKEIALNASGHYIELTERDGTLPSDRIKEDSGVIKQQADKMVDKEDKAQFTKLSELVLDNKLEEVKKLKAELEKEPTSK